MNAKHHLTCAAGLLAGALLILPSILTAETVKPNPEAEALPVFDNNYIKFSGDFAEISGSHAAFQARTQIAKKGAGGIEEFNYGYDLSKETNLQADGKFLPGAGNYLAEF